MANETEITTSGGEHEYRGMLASEWDLFRPNAAGWPDLHFYREMILDNGQPALDVACATGRLILQYLSEGLDVDGVDLSSQMLDICRLKADELGLIPTLFQQRMQDLVLPRKYRTIIVSSSSFALLTDPNDARNSLDRFFSHLEQGGKLVMTLNLYDPEDDTDTWALEGEQTRDDGALIKCFSKNRTDKATMLNHSETRYELSRNGKVLHTEHHKQSPEIRWYTPKLILDLLGEAGFVGTENSGGDIRGGFSNHPLRDVDKALLVVAIRP